MSIEQMRAAVKALYPGWNWSERVARMPVAQIIAIYNKRCLVTVRSINNARFSGNGMGLHLLYLHRMALRRR